MKNTLIILSILFAILYSCDDYDMQNAAPESTFLSGVTIGYYDTTSTNGNTHGKQIIKSELNEYDYLYKDTIIDSIFVAQDLATAKNFKLSDAWVALSVGNGRVEHLMNSPKLGIPQDFSKPVYYKIVSVYNESKLYKLIFKIK
jgi:hypothetical protein